MCTKAQTILGFCAEPWMADAGAWYDTRLGGPPLWPEPPVAELPCCPRCEQPRHLLLQAFAPHKAHLNRFLLLFACNNIRCSQHSDAWLAWRVCQLESDKNSPQNSTPNSGNITGNPEAGADNPAIDEINWDQSDSDFSSCESDTDLSDSLQLLSLKVDLARANKCQNDASSSNHSKIMEGLASTSIPALNSTPKGNRCELFGKGPTFPAAYLRVEEEKRYENKDASEEDGEIKALLQKYLSDENRRKKNSSVETWVAETEDDKSLPSQAYDFYCDVLSSAPEQVLRYSFGNKPLWPTHSIPSLTSPCACGAKLVFEFQLLSSCLYFLRVDSHIREGQNDSGMNFATVAVYTCAKDCEVAIVVHRTERWQVFEQTVVVCPDEW